MINANAQYQGLGAMTPKLQQSEIREIGLIEKVNGLLGGLSEISARLDGLAGRIGGYPTEAGNTKSNPAPAGMVDSVNQAETELRRVFERLESLSRMF